MVSTSLFAKLYVVTWKNLIIRYRHWFLTLCEIGIPLILFVIIAYGRSKVNIIGKKYVNTSTYNDPIESDLLYSKINVHATQLYYTPATEFTVDLIHKVQEKLLLYNEAIHGFNTEAELLTYHETIGKNSTNVFAVIFKDIVPNEVPRHLNYQIRPYDKLIDWKTNRLFNEFLFYVPGLASEMYVEKGFIAVKLALDTSYIETVSKNPLPVTISMQEFPYPPHIEDKSITEMFLYVFPQITIFSFVLLCPAVLKRIVEEKYTGIKELMKMMGLKSWMLWLGWFGHAFFVNFISVCLIVFFMKVPLWNATQSPIEYCSPTLYLVFMAMYCAAGITFCFAISTLFNRPTVAMTFGILVWILSYFIPKSLVLQYENMRLCKKVLLALFPNMALDFGYKAISVYETREIGAQWNNLFEQATGGKDDMTMGIVLVMLAVDIIFYMLFTLYMDAIKPGPYGLAKPYHFPVSWICDYFDKSSKTKKNRPEENSAKVESAPNLRAGIRISNLKKSFSNFEAVKGLTMDIYEGQITALLGHNGAGKTTTMSIIAGMIGASSGNVVVNGCDIKKNANKVRSSLGLCPQHNLQFTDLTVLEHLMFFGMLKGLSQADAKSEGESLLKTLCLHPKLNHMASTLSGGMRRKLSLGIALIGDSKVLILDEPTSGMDPESRREIWNMLLRYRGQRTILITTHFMEEADVLGDRIAIMDHGQLVCYGTSMFLKREFGTGYHMQLIINEDSSRDAQLLEIDKAIKNVIEHAECKSVNGNNVTYLLPINAKSQFNILLEKLENTKDLLGITNISMSLTTLEEVFLRAGNAVEKKDEENNRNSVSSNSSTSTNNSTKSVGKGLWNQRASSLLKKRYQVFVKKWGITLLQLGMPLFITILTLYLSESASDHYSDNEPKLAIDLSGYGETGVYYRADASLDAMGTNYSNIVKSQRGVVSQVDDVSEAIIEKGVENIAYYEKHLIVGAEFNDTGGKKIINAMYGVEALHAAPISLNLVMNAVLKGLMGSSFAISSTISPLYAVDVAISSPQQQSEPQVAVLWMVLLPLGLLFLTGCFILFPHMERISNVKQLQLMCGIRPLFYWMTIYICDLFFYLIVTCILLIAVVVYGWIGTDTFSGYHEILALFTILLVYGVSSILYSYLFSYKKTAAGGFASYLISNMFIGVVFTIVIMILENSGHAYYEDIGKKWKYLPMLLPQFGLTYTAVLFSRKAVQNHNWDVMPTDQKAIKCHYHYNPCCGNDVSACSAYKSYFSGNDFSIGVYLMVIAASALMYLIILMLIDSSFLKRMWAGLEVYIFMKLDAVTKKRVDNVDGGKKIDAQDVKDEKDRVFDTIEREKDKKVNSESDDDRDLLLAYDLQKNYRKNKVVKGITFGIKPGDCFGLLGINGAGKTTTFQMLTGYEPLTGGTIKITQNSNLIDINEKPTEYLEKVGYCPQFDAFNEVLTGREMLRLFGSLRGISDKKLDQVVSYWIDTLGLAEYADKACGDYSGGNKRKLNMAIALIGDPTLVMLDEPTSGVDPVSRRKLWDTLTTLKMTAKPPSILITSHSMEECEALCNKLAIMKAGQLECYGTIPRLKKKYGQGFTIMLMLKPPAISVIITNPADALECERTKSVRNSLEQELLLRQESGECSEEVRKVMADFQKKYPESVLKDQHSGLLHYHINDKSKKWSSLFKEIEELKQRHSIIEDYNISETTLEEVFLSIARAATASD